MSGAERSLRPRPIDTQTSRGGVSVGSAGVKSDSSGFSNAFSQSLLDKKTFSPLNGCVQFLLIILNTIFALAGLCVIAFLSFLFATDALDLFPSRYVDIVVVLTGAAIASVFVAFVGCIGTVNQTQKVGVLQGRRVLMVTWIAVALFLYAALNGLLKLYTLRESLDYTLDNLETSDLDKFERSVAREFNNEYFDAVCGLGSTSRLWVLVNNNCPDFMNEESCASDSSECVSCTSTCGVYTDDFLPLDVVGEVCPSVARCPSNTDSSLSGCPYVSCREGLLEFFIDSLNPVIAFLISYMILAMINIILTTLAICYNPRLSLEQKFLKTGIARVAQPKVRSPRMLQ